MTLLFSIIVSPQVFFNRACSCFPTSVGSHWMNPFPLGLDPLTGRRRRVIHRQPSWIRERSRRGWGRVSPRLAPKEMVVIAKIIGTCSILPTVNFRYSDTVKTFNVIKIWLCRYYEVKHFWHYSQAFDTAKSFLLSLLVSTTYIKSWPYHAPLAWSRTRKMRRQNARARAHSS